MSWASVCHVSWVGGLLCLPPPLPLLIPPPSATTAVLAEVGREALPSPGELGSYSLVSMATGLLAAFLHRQPLPLPGRPGALFSPHLLVTPPLPPRLPLCHRAAPGHLPLGSSPRRARPLLSSPHRPLWVPRASLCPLTPVSMGPGLGCVQGPGQECKKGQWPDYQGITGSCPSASVVWRWGLAGSGTHRTVRAPLPWVPIDARWPRALAVAPVSSSPRKARNSEFRDEPSSLKNVDSNKNSSIWATRPKG